MKRAYPREAVAFAETVRAALAELGGVDLARRAEADPRVRRGEVQPVLRQVGLFDLVPMSSPVETMAAALAVREAGAVVCPWPWVPMLSVPPAARDRADGMYLLGGPPRRLEHLDLLTSPHGIDLAGQLTPLAASGPVTPAPLDPFGTPVAPPRSPKAHAEYGPAAVALWEVLTAFWVLGALQTVAEHAYTHAATRKQFGQVIGEFGAVRWRLADIAVACAGLEEIARYTLWLLTEGRVSTTDVLALRVATLEAGRVVLAEGHQVLAAIGLCDEHDVSIVDRHLQPALRRPFGLRTSLGQLVDRIPVEGFDALFPIPPTGAGAQTP